MNTHQNARLTTWGRAELARRVIEDREPPAVVAAALHVSPGTVGKWLRRFATKGWGGLVDRSSRPHPSPRRTPPPAVQRIRRLRTRRLTGPEIAERATTASGRWGIASTPTARRSAAGPGWGKTIAVLEGAGIRHLRTRPYRPQTNGKAERFIQTALRRWAYPQPYRTSDARNAALPAFVDSYKIERPHRALGRVPPLFHFLMRCEQRLRSDT